jgi:hypothetical protein
MPSPILVRNCPRNVSKRCIKLLIFYFEYPLEKPYDRVQYAAEKTGILQPVHFSGGFRDFFHIEIPALDIFLNFKLKPRKLS